MLQGKEMSSRACAGANDMELATTRCRMPFSKGVRGAAPESTGFSRGSLAKGQTDKPERFIALPGYAARRRQGQRP